MLRKIALLLSVCCVPFLSSAQQALSAKDMVAITPMLPYGLDLPADAQSSLNMKLTQMVTQNGFGSFSPQFVLTANVVMLDKQATATAPVQFITKIEVSFFVVDVMEQVIIDETSIEVQGIDRLENKAIIQAINQIKPRNPEIRRFMDNARTKIIDYYNTRIPALLTKAQQLAEQNQYGQALAVLAAIPENVDQYPMVAEQMTAIYMKMIDRQAVAAIQDAKGKIAIRDYEGALDALMFVDPSSSHSKEAFALIDQIKGAVDAKEERELAEKWKVYEDQREAQMRAEDLAKRRIDAARAVGVEQAKTESSVANTLNKWFLGKFK